MVETRKSKQKQGMQRRRASEIVVMEAALREITYREKKERAGRRSERDCSGNQLQYAKLRRKMLVGVSPTPSGAAGIDLSHGRSEG